MCVTVSKFVKYNRCQFVMTIHIFVGSKASWNSEVCIASYLVDLTSQIKLHMRIIPFVKVRSKADHLSLLFVFTDFTPSCNAMSLRKCFDASIRYSGMSSEYLVLIVPITGRAHSLKNFVRTSRGSSLERRGDRTTTDLSIYPRL